MKRRFAYFFVLLIFFTMPLAAEIRGNWQETEAGHFKFIYEKKDARVINEFLSFSEEVYEKVCGFFQMYPESITCVVLSRIDYANGMFTSFPMHLVLFTTSPDSPMFGIDNENYLRTLLTHELTHFVHLASEKGFFYNLSRIFGSEVKTAHAVFLPEGWVIEGIAVYLETLFTEGGRGRNPFFELYSRSLVLEDKLFTLDQASYSSVFPPFSRHYVAGYIMMDYIHKKYGKDAFPKIHDAYINAPLCGIKNAIKTVTGTDAYTLFDEMKADLQERYKEEAMIPQGELLTPVTYADYSLPVITEKGLFVKKTSLETPCSIIQFDPETGKEKTIRNCTFSSLTADASGDVVIMDSYSYDFMPPVYPVLESDLFELDTGTGAVKRLTNGAHLRHPGLSRDGNYLVAVQMTGPYSRLVSVDRRTGKVEILFNAENTNVYQPVISPDGSEIAFLLSRNGLSKIYIMSVPVGPLPSSEIESGNFNTDTARPVLGTMDKSEYYPSFIDSHTLLFTSTHNSDLALYSYDMDTERLNRICMDPVGTIAGIPYGGKIIYTTYSSFGNCLKMKMADPAAEPVENRITLPPFTSTPQPSVPESVDYCDFAPPLFWFPYPSIDLYNILSQDIGAGFMVYGDSPLGLNSWVLYAAYHPLYNQPKITLTTLTRIGALALEYSLSEDYGFTTGGFFQKTTQSLELAIPFTSLYLIDRNYKFSVSLGARHIFALSAPFPFPFCNGFNFAPLTDAQRLYATGGLYFGTRPIGSPYDFYGTGLISFSLLSSIPLPVFEGTPQGFHLLGNMHVNIPFFIPNQVIQLGVTSSYTTSSLLNLRTVNPRGKFTPEPQALEGRAMGNIDYLIPIALLDQPLLFGLALTKLSCGLHVEYAFEWQPTASVFLPDRLIYTGFELQTELLYGYATEPINVLIGVSARIDSQTPALFDFARDIKPYIFIRIGDISVSASRNEENLK
ncbi:MAG: hypothetical protein JW969_03750 [Spirochaetales bacterium]|nr:hypothetical protein [Spirochaetales bacterium]